MFDVNKSIRRTLKREWGLLVVMVFLVLSLPFAMADERSLNVPSFVGNVQDEFIVVLREGYVDSLGSESPSAEEAFRGHPDFEQLAQRFEVGQLRRQFPGKRFNPSVLETERRMARHFKVQFQRGTLEQAMAAYAANPQVERVEPIGIHTLQEDPNDTNYFGTSSFPYDQWHYRDIPGVEADRAWGSQTGDSNVVVGILDSGVRYFHLDLGGDNANWSPDSPPDNGNIWINPGEIAGNGFDDDGNGYVDDTIGWDFVSSTKGGVFTRC
ncbi:MAG: hypothetical protein ACWGQW_19375, partial [bacterium]